jgi:hypothetical protein
MKNGYSLEQMEGEGIPPCLLMNAGAQIPKILTSNQHPSKVFHTFLLVEKSKPGVGNLLSEGRAISGIEL